MAAPNRRLAVHLRHLTLPGRQRRYVQSLVIPTRAVAAAGDQQGVDDGSVNVVPLPGAPNFGVEIVGLDIRACLRADWGQGHEAVEYLDALVATHGLLLFRNQLPRLAAEELIAFSKWFGSGQLHSARTAAIPACT